jgi:hypothetical protein
MRQSKNQSKRTMSAAEEREQHGMIDSDPLCKHMSPAVTTKRQNAHFRGSPPPQVCMCHRSPRATFPSKSALIAIWSLEPALIGRKGCPHMSRLSLERGRTTNTLFAMTCHRNTSADFMAFARSFVFVSLDKWWEALSAVGLGYF